MKRILTILTFFVVLLVSFPTITSASTKLDEIQLYKMTIDMREDGTMDIKYHIEWKVLDSTSEGPLTWVKIGIPNDKVNEITAMSDTIDNIYYYSDNGAYVRIDFKKAYYKDDIVTFEYSIHQSYMYTLEDNLIKYNFTPGWFDSIEVKEITILWNNEAILEANNTSADRKYLIWNSTLAMGESINASVNYEADAFYTNAEEQYFEGEEPVSAATFLIVMFIIVAIVFIVIIKMSKSNYRGGFGGGSTRVFIAGGGRSCACASSCACACACACAGGGRAGCSIKNFYGASIQTEKFIKTLNINNNMESEKMNEKR